MDLARLQQLAGLFSHQEVSTFLQCGGQQDSAPPVLSPNRTGVSLKELGEELDNLRTVAEMSKKEKIALVDKQKEEFNEMEEELKNQMAKTLKNLSKRHEEEINVQDAKLDKVERRIDELEEKIQANISSPDKLASPRSREVCQQSVTSLLYSATTGDLPTLHRLHSQGQEMGLADYDGRTALHLACAEGRLQCVQFLVAECGLQPTVQDR